MNVTDSQDNEPQRVRVEQQPYPYSYRIERMPDERGFIRKINEAFVLAHAEGVEGRIGPFIARFCEDGCHQEAYEAELQRMVDEGFRNPRKKKSLWGFLLTLTAGVVVLAAILAVLFAVMAVVLIVLYFVLAFTGVTTP